VISTDDAGILRTNMIEQYVLLASRYKDVSYESSSMCTTVSITALSRTKIKKQLLKDLDSRFTTFEANFPLK
jgi:adenosine deaminase/adenosine deaminase CECR1